MAPAQGRLDLLLQRRHDLAAQSPANRGFAKIARDMTMHKQLAQAQDLVLVTQEQTMRRQAQAAVNLKDEFLAVMSHELKHPLNLIHVNAELLSRSPEARAVIPAVARASQAIRRAAANQAKIIDDLLDLSRVRTGKMALLARPTCGSTTPFESIYQAAKRRCPPAARSTWSSNAPKLPLTVHGDEVRIEQIVWNLVTNAIKFTPEGGTVTIALARMTSAARRARITVRDTGRGIEAAFLPHIFEMFSQEEPGPRLRTNAVWASAWPWCTNWWSHKVAKSAPIRPVPGKGSVFTVMLPLVEKQDACGRGGAERRHGDDVNPLAGLRVLLVDDSIETLESVRRVAALRGRRGRQRQRWRRSLATTRRRWL